MEIRSPITKSIKIQSPITKSIELVSNIIRKLDIRSEIALEIYTAPLVKPVNRVTTNGDYRTTTPGDTRIYG